MRPLDGIAVARLKGLFSVLNTFSEWLHENYRLPEGLSLDDQPITPSQRWLPRRLRSDVMVEGRPLPLASSAGQSTPQLYDGPMVLVRSDYITVCRVVSLAYPRT